MLPYIRLERDKGEHLDQIPHEFSPEVVATKKGWKSSRRRRTSSRGRNISTKKDTSKGEASSIVVIDEVPLVVGVIEKSDKRKSSKERRVKWKRVRLKTRFWGLEHLEHVGTSGFQESIPALFQGCFDLGAPPSFTFCPFAPPTGPRRAIWRYRALKSPIPVKYPD